jgi:hypothetical protein
LELGSSGKETAGQDTVDPFNGNSTNHAPPPKEERTQYYEKIWITYHVEAKLICTGYRPSGMAAGDIPFYTI